MKKILLIGLLTVMSVGIYASVSFVSSCGKATTTVSPNYFDSWEEALEWYQELDEILCGED